MLLTALGAVITSLITGYDWQVAGATYVNLAMFFAFATLYPDAQVLLFFFIPVKIKWMAILDACYFAYIIFFCAVGRYWIGAVLPLAEALLKVEYGAAEIEDAAPDWDQNQLICALYAALVRRADEIGVKDVKFPPKAGETATLP